MPLRHPLCVMFVDKISYLWRGGYLDYHVQNLRARYPRSWRKTFLEVESLKHTLRMYFNHFLHCVLPILGVYLVFFEYFMLENIREIYVHVPSLIISLYLLLNTNYFYFILCLTLIKQNSPGAGFASSRLRFFALSRRNSLV